MSDETLRSAMGRITAATPESPILVHRTAKPDMIGCVFGATVGTVAAIMRGQYAAGSPTELVGVWSREDVRRQSRRDAIVAQIAEAMRSAEVAP